jgi:hypothetical protein
VDQYMLILVSKVDDSFYRIATDYLVPTKDKVRLVFKRLNIGHDKRIYIVHEGFVR